MVPVAFYPEHHLADLNGWLAARGMPAIPPEMLPSVGYCVPGVAAAFLYRTDSAVALIDVLASNPAAPARATHAAIGAIVDALVGEAKRLGYSHMVGYTGFRGVGRLAVRHGFSPGEERRTFARKV